MRGRDFLNIYTFAGMALAAMGVVLTVAYHGKRPPAVPVAPGDARQPESLPPAPSAKIKIPRKPPFWYRSLSLVSGDTAGVPSLQSFTSLAAALDGSAYLLDSFNSRVLHVSVGGRVLLDLPRGSLGGTAKAIAALPDDTFVAWLEERSDRLERFDARGRKLTPLQLPASQPGIHQIGDLQLGPDGILYALDAIPGRVYRFRPGGVPLPPLSLPEVKRISHAGAHTRLAVSRDSLYLAGEGAELLRYRLDGTFAGRVPLPIWAEEFVCDSSGNVLVLMVRPSDEGLATPRSVVRIDPKGRVLGVWEPARGLGQGELSGTAVMSMAPQDVLITLERQGPEAEVPHFAARLQRWRPAAVNPAPLRVIREAANASSSPPVVLRRVLRTRLGARFGRLTAPVAGRHGQIYVGETLVDPYTRRARTRVLRFSAKGTSVEAIGEGTFENRDGHPASIAAVAFDTRKEELYAASDTEHLIRVFGPDGRARRTLPLPTGFKNQAFVARPLSLTCLPGGTLLLPEDDRSHLWVFDPAKRAWHRFGNWGQGPSGFHMPVAVSAAPTGELYVADTHNRRVVRRDSRLQYQFEIRRRHDEPWDVAAARDGGSAVVYADAIVRYDPRGRMLWSWSLPEMQGSIGAGWGTGGAHREGGLAVATDDTVYQTTRLSDGDPNSPSYMLMVLGKRSAEEARAPRLAEVGKETGRRFRSSRGAPPLDVTTVALTPLGLCIGPALVRINGRVLRTLPPSPTAEAQPDRPPAQIVDACWTDGRLVLLEAPPKDSEGWMSLRIHDSKGDFVAAHRLPLHFGSPGWSLGGIPPERIPPLMAAGDGLIFITSPNQGEVLACDLSGSVHRRLGKGLLQRPTGVAVGPGGEVYVADAARKRVEVFASGGEHLRSLGGPGQADFLDPGSLAFGPDATLYVVDRGAGEVVRLTPRGKRIGGSETSGGAVLSRIAVDRDGTVYLAGDRLRILRSR